MLLLLVSVPTLIWWPEGRTEPPSSPPLSSSPLDPIFLPRRGARCRVPARGLHSCCLSSGRGRFLCAPCRAFRVGVWLSAGTLGHVTEPPAPRCVASSSAPAPNAPAPQGSLLRAKAAGVGGGTAEAEEFESLMLPAARQLFTARLSVTWNGLRGHPDSTQETNKGSFAGLRCCRKHPAIMGWFMGQ